MSKKKYRPGEGQAAFMFEPLHIPKEYDEEKAKQAAQRRYKRIGELALNKEVTAGFRRKTSGLWVPYSKAENTSVVSSPNSQLIKERLMAKGRVKEKYQDSDVHSGKVERWASFAAQRTLKERRAKYRTYFQQAKQHLIGLETGLRADRTYDAESIMDGRWAINWLKEYVIALRGFNNHRWIQSNWRKQRADEIAWATDYVGNLNDEQLTDHYDESVWNSWSRKNYWQEQIQPPANYDTHRSSELPPDDSYIVPNEDDV